MTKNHYAHLLGKDPISGTQFNDRAFLNSAYWEEIPDSQFGTLGYCRSIKSLPKEDIERLHKVSPKPDESLQRIQFVLKNSDLRSATDEVTPQKVSIQPPFEEKADERILSYNLHLHLIETLCAEGQLWIAAAPQCTHSTVWRHHGYAQDKLKWPEETPRLGSKDILVKLGTETQRFHAHRRCNAHLLIFDDLGIEIPKLKQVWSINRKAPFVAVIGTEFAFECQQTRNEPTPVGIANEAFLELIKSDPQKAQTLWDQAIKDLHTYLKQDEDEDYWDISMFKEDFAVDLSTYFNPEKGNDALAKKFRDSIKYNVRDVVSYASPQVNALINAGATLHVTQITLTKNNLKLSVTVEHPKTVVFVEIDGPKVTTTEKPRKRR